METSQLWEFSWDAHLHTFVNNLATGASNHSDDVTILYPYGESRTHWLQLQWFVLTNTTADLAAHAPGLHDAIGTIHPRSHTQGAVPPILLTHFGFPYNARVGQ